MKLIHIDSQFCLILHHYAKRDTALRSEPAGFPDESEDKRRARIERRSATRQLGANWGGIHRSLLLGKLGEAMLLWLVGPETLCSVVGGGQHNEAPRVSKEVLKLPIKGKHLLGGSRSRAGSIELFSHRFDLCHESTRKDETNVTYSTKT